MRACSYIRVSTEEQNEDGHSLAAQDERNRAEVTRRGWQLDRVYEEVVSTGQPIDKRRHLSEALQALDAGEHQVLVVANLDRMCRSSLEFQLILDRSIKNGWQLLMLNPMVDTTTPYGAAFAAIGAVFAQLERALISQRTKDALAHLKAQGKQLGAPGYDNPDVLDQIHTLRHTGLSWHRIADHLNDEGIPAMKGGRWYQATVARVAERDERRKAAA